MSSILKVDQIQSDSGTINVASNINTAGNFAITGNLTASGMSSPGGTMNVSSDIATTGNVSINGKATINSDGRQFSVIGAGSTLYEDFKCRAWVNFNGTGTPAIRASGNVSSITDNGIGLYTINFTNAMPDADYSVGTSASGDDATSVSPRTFTTTGFALRTATGGGGATATDYATVCAQIFR